MSKKLSRKKTFYIVMTILIAIVIFLFSSISSPIGEKTGLNLASFYHFGVFFMFTFFLLLAIKNGKLNTKTILMILFLSLIYAASDEFHQLFVPGRFADIKDVMIDFAGSILSVIILKILEKFNKL
jgi:hypothetical protein